MTDQARKEDDSLAAEVAIATARTTERYLEALKNIDKRAAEREEAEKKSGTNGSTKPVKAE